ncbi:MAG: hypothetical protein JWL59_5069 [Chthoniobacteraceae bacterium]|nr:hypothetical protein [Chthoniobacteraceae bacterium]
MKKRIVTFFTLAASLVSAASGADGKLTGLRIDATGTTELALKGKGARQQIIVTGKLESGAERDFTHKAHYEAAPNDVVSVDGDGVVSAISDGAAMLTVTADGVASTLPIKVEGSGSFPPINFANQIVPIFTKAGCNAGGCHGKLSGQNGFKLSLLGFEPAEDYEHLVKEARGRRVFPAAPENSLLLLKGVATAPHGGGKRLEPDSDDYRLLVRWIGQGLSYGKPTDPKLERIEVIPKQRTMTLGSDQQLIVLARYTDGSVQDVTRSALYEPNEKSMAKTDEVGRVTLFDQPGDVAVMVRYQTEVGTFHATVPLGAPVENLPAPRNYIDELVFAKLTAMGMPPSAACDDATFIRRVSLDIAGRLPSLEETRRFAADTAPDKSDKLIDSLLESGDYADFFATKWSSLLRNKRTKPADARGNFAFREWIRDSLRNNKPYDQFMREIVAASGAIAENPPVAWYRQVKEPQQQLEDTAQLFLGMRLQCAQCHHHPFEKWSQNDYYSFAAFFSQVGRKGEETIFHRRGMAVAQNKKTKQPVKPVALGAAPVEIAPDDDPRLALADWIGGKENPFFARSLANRYWKHFFNRGIVEPEDDMRETNPPSNPELLDALARHFSESGFDLKALIRSIAQSRTYRLSALPNEFNKSDRQNFSRYYPKRLPAEVLLDGVNQVINGRSSFAGLPPGTHAIALPDNSFNASSYFLTVFGRPDSSSACECERTQEASLAQSLHLLNSKEIQQALSADTGRAALLAADVRPDEEKLRDLHLLAYSREPEARELAIAKSHVEKPRNGPDGKPLPELQSKRQGYEDILWAIINTKEFLFNH